MGNFTEHQQQDIRGRYHLWVTPLDHTDLPTVEDLYEYARSVVHDFDRREWDLSQETLTAGAYHLVEKGFISWPSTS
jgi:hypothetical protein